MAIQNTTLSSAMHDWYATRSGEPANVQTDMHKRSYFISKGIAGSISGVAKPLSQMEREWLQTQTGVTSKRLPDMWVEAVAGAGKTPSKSINENQYIFYSQVIGTP